MEHKSGIFQPAQVPAGRQFGKEPRISEANAPAEGTGRSETAATMDARGPGLRGAIPVDTVSQAHQFLDPGPLRHSGSREKSPDVGTRTVMEEIPEVDGASFDGMDPQVQHDWDDLMEAAERGSFRAIDEDDDTSPITGAAQRTSSIRRS